MTTIRLAWLVMATMLFCSMAAGAEPARLSAPKPPSLWSKLFGRTQSMPVARPMPRQRPSSGSGRHASSGVERASFEEPASAVAPPVRPQKAPLPLTSWFRRPRRPSRTVSEYMAEERP